MRAIDHRRVAIDRIWVRDILRKYQAIQHQAAPTKCDIREWPS
jgi:hypothetical protein